LLFRLSSLVLPPFWPPPPRRVLVAGFLFCRKLFFLFVFLLPLFSCRPGNFGEVGFLSPLWHLPPELVVVATPLFPSPFNTFSGLALFFALFPGGGGPAPFFGFFDRCAWTELFWALGVFVFRLGSSFESTLGLDGHVSFIVKGRSLFFVLLVCTPRESPPPPNVFLQFSFPHVDPGFFC